MDDIAEILDKVGLSNKEIAVFLALARGGPMTAHGVARKSGVTRTHVYDIAEELVTRGLVTVSKGSGAKKYEAIDHQGLLAHLSRKESEVHALRKRVTEAASLFDALRENREQRTKIKFYEGVEGLRTVYLEIKADLSAQAGKKEMVTWWPTGALEKAIPDFFENSRFIDMPGFIKRDIFDDSESAQKYIDAYKRGPTTYAYKFWPKERGEFPADVVVWGSKVSFTDVRGAPAGIVIDNQSVADSMRMWFDAVWELLPPH